MTQIKTMIIGAFLGLSLLGAASARGQASLAAANWVQRGNQALAEKKYDEALEFFKKAEVDLPDSAEVAYDRGIALYRKGEFDKARESFGNALRTRDPKLEAQAKFNLGNCSYSTALGKLTDLQGAIEELRKSINYWRDSLELNPADTEAKQNIETAQLLIKDLLDKEKKKQEEEQKKQQEQQQDQKQDQKDQKDQKDQQQQDQKDQQQNKDQQNKDQQMKDQKDQQDQQKKNDQQKNKDQQQKDKDQQEKEKQEKEKQQAQKKKDQMSREDAERQLQAIRDKERARRDDKRKQEAMYGGREPVDRDW